VSPGPQRTSSLRPVSLVAVPADENQFALDDDADLLVFVAVLRDDRARFDLEPLDAHPVAGRQLREVDAVDGLDGLRVVACDPFHIDASTPRRLETPAGDHRGVRSVAFGVVRSNATLTAAPTSMTIPPKYRKRTNRRSPPMTPYAA